MSLYRWEARARLEDGMTERRFDGAGLRLVTVCVTDERAGEVSNELRDTSRDTSCARAAAGADAAAGERGARLAFWLELAEWRTEEVEDERA